MSDPDEWWDDAERNDRFDEDDDWEDDEWDKWGDDDWDEKE